MRQRLAARLRSLWHRNRLEAELDEEIRFHLSEETDARVAGGLSPDDARVAARREFGNVASIRARTREVWVWPWVQDVGQDVRFAVRLLIKAPWFTSTVVLTLGLAIGVNTALFTFVNSWVVRDLPVPEPDRVVSIRTVNDRGRRLRASVPDYEDWRAQSRSFSELAAVYDSQSVNLGDDVRVAERARSAWITANLFALIGQAPLVGRDFADADDRPGAPLVAIIGHTIWQNRYGGDPEVLGRILRVNGEVATIVGVMPPDVHVPNNVNIWLPLVQLPSDVQSGSRDARILRVLGRLATGVSVEQARAELASLGRRLGQLHPATNEHTVPSLVPFAQEVRGGDWRAAAFLQGLVVFVLLVASANVANLLLVRASRRSGEMSIRASLGASRGRVIRQLLVESVMLASLAGLAGIGLSVIGVRWLVEVLRNLGAPYGLPFEMTMDGVVFAFVAAIGLVVVAFGLAPALLVGKTDVSTALKEGGRDAIGGVRARRWTSALVVLELALTLTLLAGAGFMARSFVARFWVDLGVDPAPLLTMRISMVQPKYAEPESRAEVFQRIEARLAGIAAIEAAAMATSAPFQFGVSRRLAVEGRPAPAGEARPTITRLLVGDGYFDTVGVRLLRGRAFAPSDGLPGRQTAIVNRRFAAMHFPGQDPIGRRIKLEAPNRPGRQPLGVVDEADAPWLTIVGLVPDIRQEEESPAQVSLVYLPYRTEYLPSGDLIVRARAGNPAELAPLVQEAVREIDPDLAFFNIQTLQQLLAWRRSESRLFVSVLATFALFALFLSALGLYAVTAYSVAQRTREIGLRVALGARPAQVQGLVLGLALRQLAIGLAIGVAGALGIGRVMRGLLFGTTPTDPTTLAAIVAILTGVALAASWLPARRAARVDPMVAFRSE